ncbi:MAG: hypothetical protein ACFCBU_18765, partial [Cyanophyceae cyanobacterium]
MADPASSQFSNQSAGGAGSDPGNSPPEDMGLLENLVDLLAENLDQREESEAISDTLDVSDRYLS